MQLSPNFTVAEFEFSYTAERHGIDNSMPDALIPDARKLCELVLQPLRDGTRRPVIITSGYRSIKLNNRVRGSRTSQHILGQAADIRVIGMEPWQVCEKIIALNLPFDQLILEFGKWTHVSYSDRNRREILTAYKSPANRTAYARGIEQSRFA